MSTITLEEIREADDLIRGVPVVAFEPPATQLVRNDRGKFQTVTTAGWIKFSIAFRDDLARLKGCRLAVFICICLHVNEGGRAWPGVRTICRETGYASAAVTLALHELSEIPGLLGITRRPGKSNEYRPAFAAYGRTSTPEKRNTVPPKSETVVPTKSETKEEPYKKNQEEDSPAPKPRGAKRPEEREFLDLFTELTGVPEPMPGTDRERRAAAVRHYQPVARMVRLANGRGPACLREAVRRMRHDGLTISAPQSVEQVFTAVYGESQTPAVPVAIYE